MPVKHLESIHSEGERSLAGTANSLSVTSLHSFAARLLNFICSNSLVQLVFISEFQNNLPILTVQDLSQRYGDIFSKLVNQLQSFMKTDGSLKCSQKRATALCPDVTAKLSPHIHILFLLFLKDFKLKFCMHYLLPFATRLNHDYIW